VRRGRSELGRTKERRHGIAQLVGGDGDEVVAARTPAVFLTTHPELGDVSQGQLLTIKNSTG
jgi:hypothetical protein